MQEYTVGSLFAGVGGVCQAFKDASCKVLWANELDSNSCKTYRLNHTTTQLIEDDVRNLKGSDLISVDILTAGFPCQPFSNAGHGRGFDDERGKLFFEFSRLLNEIKPKAYLLENVKTLAFHNKGKSFEIIKGEILKAGYSFIPFILNAAHHTDIPQGRERIYIVGFKNEGDYHYSKPIKRNVNKEFNHLNLSSSFIIPPKSLKKRRPIASFVESETVALDDYYNKLDNKIHQRVIEAVKEEGRVYQYRRYYVRENKSNVCPTLTANMGGGGHNIPIILDGDTPRRLTPKECFNLQGFPEVFQLPTGVAKGQLYKQSGNTVVVPLVARIAKEIVRVLDESGNS